MADKTKKNTNPEDQAEVDALLANPNRQPADDKRLDELLHGKNPVVTGDVSVDPVGATEGGTGLTDRASIKDGATDDVHREIPNPNDKEVPVVPAPDATEAGASRAGSNATKKAGEQQKGAGSKAEQDAKAKADADKEAEDKAKKDQEGK